MAEHMAKHDEGGVDESMGDVLGQLEVSFAHLQTALAEANEKTTIYERFDVTITQAIAEAMEVASAIRARAAREAESTQELMRQEAVQSLREIAAVRERCQQICQEILQVQEERRQSLERERQQHTQELAEMRRAAEEEISLLRAQALGERDALREEIASLQRQRDLIYQQVETSLLGQLRTLKRSIVQEPAIQETAAPPAPRAMPAEAPRESPGARTAAAESTGDGDASQASVEPQPARRRSRLWRILLGRS